MKRNCLTLNLKNDPDLIDEYKTYHKKIWPAISKSIRESGIAEMEIYLLGNRLFMIMETEEGFSFERKAVMDAGNEKVNEWEELMWKYQEALPGAKPGEKWLKMEKIFSLSEQE